MQASEDDPPPINDLKAKVLRFNTEDLAYFHKYRGFCTHFLFRAVLSSTIGLNVGTNYIGVGVSDSKFLRASPHCVIMRNNNNVDKIALELQRLITKQTGLGLIFGHPYNRGSMNTNATQVYRLTYDLGKTNIIDNNIPYAFWEDGFTSKDSSYEDGELD